MNEIELLKSLSARTQTGSIEIDDVSSRVLRDIRTRRPPTDRGAWEVAGGAACAAALLMAVFAGQAWSSFQNPLTDIASVLPSE